MVKLRATTVSRPGYDLTFSAPKSVSLAWALGEPAQAERVGLAHGEAVREAVRYLEAEACFVRRGHAGAEVVPANGFVAATFQHRTNRSLDPQLHTHVVLANMAEGPDGRWTALDGRRIFEHSRTAGAIYQARLRHELANDPGLLFEPKPNGTFEIVGISPEQKRQFSKRRQQIEAELAALGPLTPRSAQVATLTTRPDKAPASTDEQLRRRWELEAAAVDLDVTRLPAYRRTPSVEVDNAAVASTLTESDAAFRRQHAIRAIADAATEGATLDQLEAAADHFLASRHVVDLGEGWWTTPGELAFERRAVDLAAAPRRAPIADERALAAAIAARPSLSDEQAAVVAGVSRSAAPVDLVVGWAGTGKTFSLDAVRQAHEASGHTFIGAALSARAAAELEGGSGIPSTTADRLLLQLSSGQRRLTTDTVVVIDEAGMLGNRQLAAFIDEAAQADAKLILVGDPKQLPEMDPGGLFKSLAERLGHHELTDNRRQLDPIERQAVTDIRLGNAPAAVERLVDHGRIVTADNADQLRDLMVADWYQAYASGQSVLLTASRRSAVTDLNQRARRTLADHGQLGCTVLTHAGTDYAIGDQVMTLRNNRRLGLTNGQLGTVTGAAGHGGLRVRRADGTSRDLPAATFPPTTSPPGTSPTATPRPSTRTKAPRSTRPSSSPTTPSAKRAATRPSHEAEPPTASTSSAPNPANTNAASTTPSTCSPTRSADPRPRPPPSTGSDPHPPSTSERPPHATRTPRRLQRQALHGRHPSPRQHQRLDLRRRMARRQAHRSPRVHADLRRSHDRRPAPARAPRQPPPRLARRTPGSPPRPIRLLDRHRAHSAARRRRRRLDSDAQMGQGHPRPP